MNNKMFSDVVPRVPWPKSSRSGWEEGLGDGEFDVSTNKEEQHCIGLHSKEFIYIYIKSTFKIQEKSKQHIFLLLNTKKQKKNMKNQTLRNDTPTSMPWTDASKEPSVPSGSRRSAGSQKLGVFDFFGIRRRIH